MGYSLSNKAEIIHYSFEENLGQYDSTIKFSLKKNDYSILFLQDRFRRI